MTCFRSTSISKAISQELFAEGGQVFERYDEFLFASDRSFDPPLQVKTIVQRPTGMPATGQQQFLFPAPNQTRGFEQVIENQEEVSSRAGCVFSFRPRRCPAACATLRHRKMSVLWHSATLRLLPSPSISESRLQMTNQIQSTRRKELPQFSAPSDEHSRPMMSPAPVYPLVALKHCKCPKESRRFTES